MRFEELEISGAFLVTVDAHDDERGSFCRIACEEEFGAQGLIGRFTQSSISSNILRGTVRGMHYSIEPHAETKLVRCIAGQVHDVIVDLRQTSRTYLQSAALTLSAENRRAIYIPIGCAHGFQTLSDGAEVLYMIDKPYVAGYGRGLRWNDPALDVVWPEPVRVISDRDLVFPDWQRRTGSE